MSTHGICSKICSIRCFGVLLAKTCLEAQEGRHLHSCNRFMVQPFSIAALGFFFVQGASVASVRRWR